MSERGTELMAKVSRQLDEMAEFVRNLNEADLRKPCPDDDAGDTVGAVVAHMAEGYHSVGRFLQSTGYVPGSLATGKSHGHGHGHERAHAPEAVPDVLDRLTSGKTPIGLLADLTDEQFDSVPPAVNRFADGRRTLERVIDAVIAHQAAHLVTLERAVT